MHTVYICLNSLIKYTFCIQYTLWCEHYSTEIPNLTKYKLVKVSAICVLYTGQKVSFL